MEPIEVNEKRFRRVINRIGIAMLIFLATINVLGLAWNYIEIILFINYDTVTATVISQLIYAVVYMLSFLIPTLLLKPLLGKDYRPIMLEARLPSTWGAYVAAGITVILSAAVVNSMFVSVFGYSEFSAEYIWGNGPKENYEVVLSFITMAMVPGICEELLFRGAILSALKPYGKAPAIIISAVLFGLMHQNAEQLFYATVAGIVLGWVACETRSIWCGIIIHFFNNLFSVLLNTLLERMPSAQGNVISYIIEALVFVAGICSLIYIVKKQSRRKNERKVLVAEGIYQRAVEEVANESQALVQIRAGRLGRLFFTPAMIAFIVICCVTMLIYILMSIMMTESFIV